MEVKIPMLDLTTTQGEILQKFVENFTAKSGKYPKGLSSHILDDLGIVAKTFRLNKGYLEDNYLIRINRIEYHGHRTYLFYKITKLGIIAYLTWQIKTKKIKKTTITKLSFPIIVKHWTFLQKKYGKLLNNILLYTTQHIEITPTIKAEGRDGIGYSDSLNEGITLPMNKLHFKIFKQYEAPKIISTKKIKPDWGETEDFSDNLNSEIDVSITERYTFLFFFNLINLGFEQWEQITLFFNSGYIEDSTNMRKDLEKTIKKLTENSKVVIKLIKNDGALNNIFHTMLDEINLKLNDVNAIKEIQKELS